MAPPLSLRSRSEISKVFGRGKKHSSPDLSLRSISAEHEQARFAIVVLKGLGSVGRNRVRRRVREALRLAGDLKPGTDAIIIAGHGIEKIPFNEVRGQICQILDAAGLRKAP